jgi:hypothetical protein
MFMQHHYRKNTRNKYIYKITNRTKLKRFTSRKDSYILFYTFQRGDSENLIVVFYKDMTIGLIKYCKLSSFVLHKWKKLQYIYFDLLKIVKLSNLAKKKYSQHPQKVLGKLISSLKV